MDSPIRRPEEILAYRPLRQILGARAEGTMGRRPRRQRARGAADHGGQGYRLPGGSRPGGAGRRVVGARLRATPGAGREARGGDAGRRTDDARRRHVSIRPHTFARLPEADAPARHSPSAGRRQRQGRSRSSRSATCWAKRSRTTPGSSQELERERHDDLHLDRMTGAMSRRSR